MQCIMISGYSIQSDAILSNLLYAHAVPTAYQRPSFLRCCKMQRQCCPFWLRAFYMLTWKAELMILTQNHWRQNRINWQDCLSFSSIPCSQLQHPFMCTLSKFKNAKLPLICRLLSFALPATLLMKPLITFWNFTIRQGSDSYSKNRFGPVPSNIIDPEKMS